MLVDSHCHLDYPALAKDREGVVARARNAGVMHMVNIGTTRHGFEPVLKTAEEFDDVTCSFGVHPHHVAEEGEMLSVKEIVDVTKHPKVVGIGETGLDYFYKHGPRDMQEESFRRHIRAGVESDLPIIIHSRDAEEDTIRVLREELAGVKNPRALLHCFSSRRVLAEEAVEIGIYVSLSGILTFKKSQDLRDAARDLPLDKLLVETDAPFLAPEPHRGKICEPAHVADTARVLAELKGVSFAAIAAQTTDNFYRLFSKVPRPA